MLASASRVSKRASLKRALDFSTPEALRKYLKDHPDADKARHKVVKPEARQTKEEPSGKPRQPGKEEAPTKSKPPPIPEEAKKKTKAKPPPIPEEAKRKKPEIKEPPKPKDPESKEPSGKPEATESGTDSTKPGFTWKGRFKDLSDKASNFVSGSAKSFRHFLGDDDFRHEALKEARGALTRAPGKLAASLVETAKHEVKDFKYASSGVKSVLSGGKMTKKQKAAFTEVASHMALAAASASLLASSPLVGAALFAKSLAAHVAAKSVSRSVEKLHILGEVGHVGHGLAHLISHIAAEGKKREMMEPEEAMVKLVMAAVAKELDNLTDKDFAEILEKCGEESETTKTASRVVTRFLEA